MEYVHIGGARKVLSRPSQNDGLIRAWLSEQGWRVGHVKDGTVFVPSEDHANYLTTLMARKWQEVIPLPRVGIY